MTTEPLAEEPRCASGSRACARSWTPRRRRTPSPTRGRPGRRGRAAPEPAGGADRVSGPLLLAVESSCDETGIAAGRGRPADPRQRRRQPGRPPRADRRASSRRSPRAPTCAGSCPCSTRRSRPPASRWPTSTRVAVTYGPGLAGSLLVGINFAKTLAWAHGKPLVPVNHLEGHVYAGWLLDPGEAEREAPPVPAGRARRVGRAHVPRRDARPPRLPPAGHDRRRRRGRGVRQGGAPAGPRLPGRPGDLAGGRGRGRAGPRLPAGLAARLLRPVVLGPQDRRPADRRARPGPTPACPPTSARAGRCPTRVVAELAWGFQDSVVDVLATKTIRAAEEVDARGIVLGGGVAANAALRARIAGEAGRARPRDGHPATRPVHGQRGDDRRRGGPAARGGRARRPRPRRAAVAAARPMTRRRARDDRAPRATCASTRATSSGACARPACGRATTSPRTSSPTSRSSRRSWREARSRRPGAGVLEIGPGLGFLTGGLLAAGARVTAVELDRGLVGGAARDVRGGARGRAPSGSWRATRSTRTSSTSSRSRTTSSPTSRTTSPARSCTACWARRPAPAAARPDGPARGRGAGGGAAGRDELPVGLLPVPRAGAGRVPGPARRLRARAQGRVRGARPRALRHRRPARRRGRGPAVARRPGRRSGSGAR